MKKALSLCFALLCLLLGPSRASAQELLCTIEVNSSQVEGTNKSVFDNLKETLNSYMNETKFSDATFSPTEKLECRLPDRQGVRG